MEFEHKIVDLQNKPPDFQALYSSIHPNPTVGAKVRGIYVKQHPLGPTMGPDPTTHLPNSTKPAGPHPGARRED